MRTVGFVCAVAACAGGANAFVASSLRPASMTRARTAGVRMASEVTVPDLLKQTEKLKLLSTASRLGLLSKLEKAGLTLKDVEKLLPLVDENDLIGIAKGAAPSILKVAPAALAAAPSALPLLAAALDIPGEALYIGALGSLGAGVALITILPDDSVTGVALETFLAFPLLFVLPAVCGVAGFALSSLKNGSLVNAITKASSAAAASSAPVAAVAVASRAAPVASRAAPVAAAKSSGGRPAVAARERPAAASKAKAAPRPTPKKAAPKPPPAAPKPMGNISNLPKAL